jgi:hypothetical protein
MVITCIWNVCLFKMCSLSIVICSRYRPSHDDGARHKCDISRSCYCLWFLLQRIVWSLSACVVFFYLSMYVDVFVKCKWDRCMSGFDKPNESSLSHLQTNNHWMYLHRISLSTDNIDIQTNTTRKHNRECCPRVETSPPVGMDNNVQRDYFFFTTWLQHMIDDYD